MTPPELPRDPADPRADVAQLRGPRVAEFDPWARATLERALARGRMAWPNGPTMELRVWGQLDGLASGGASYLDLAEARAASSGLRLSPDELLLATAGFAAANPELVARHLERAGRVA